MARSKNKTTAARKVAKARAAPRAGRAGKRGALDAGFRAMGRYLRKRMNLANGIPSYSAHADRRANVLDRFIQTTTGRLQADTVINREFRAAWGAQDEWFSTASMREVVKGFMDGIQRSAMADDEWAHARSLVDLLSNIRMPTEQSGFSLATRVMQHPASRDAAYFADPYATASLHARLDSARRRYVTRAVEQAIADEADAEEVVKAAGRAAIEFTLNHFTAPVTASNVKPFSRLASAGDDDERLISQMEAREHLKTIYEQLGGQLRQSDPIDVPGSSASRPWPDFGLNPDTVPEQAPPSPRRSRLAQASSNEDDLLLEDVSSPVPTHDLADPANPLAAPMDTASDAAMGEGMEMTTFSSVEVDAEAAEAMVEMAAML